MSEFERLSAELLPVNLRSIEEAIQQHVPRSWNVGFDVALVERARRVLTHADAAVEYLDQGESRAARTWAEEALRTLVSFRDTPRETFTQETEAQRVMSLFHDYLRNLTWKLAPVTLLAAGDLIDSTQELNDLKSNARERLRELEDLRLATTEALSAAQEAAAIRGTTQLSAEFSRLASGKQRSAASWLWAALATGVLLGLVVVWLAVELRSQDGSQPTDVLRTALTKASFGGLLTYAMVFCSRNYRSAKHLQNEYEARSTTIQVAQALREGLTDETARDTILHTAVVNAFTAPSSGLVRSSGSDDEPALALAMLSALRSAR